MNARRDPADGAKLPDGADDALKRHRIAVWKDEVRMAIRGVLSEADGYGALGSDLLEELESELQDLPRLLTRARGGFHLASTGEPEQ